MTVQESVKLYDAMRRVGNCVHNKGGNRKDREAWEYIKALLHKLEDES